jgi:hypothetical protein
MEKAPSRFDWTNIGLCKRASCLRTISSEVSSTSCPSSRISQPGVDRIQGRVKLDASRISFSFFDGRTTPTFFHCKYARRAILARSSLDLAAACEIPRACASSFVEYPRACCSSTTSREAGRNLTIALFSKSLISFCI